MSATLLKGKPIADGMMEELKKEIAVLKEKHDIVPSLGGLVVAH